MSVDQYHTYLEIIWQELDLFYDLDLGCEKCCLKPKKLTDRERLFEFLTGLNKELDEVRGRILSRSPIPMIDDAFAKVRREEARKKIRLGSINLGPTNGSAFIL